MCVEDEVCGVGTQCTVGASSQTNARGIETEVGGAYECVCRVAKNSDYGERKRKDRSWYYFQTSVAQSNRTNDRIPLYIPQSGGEL